MWQIPVWLRNFQCHEGVFGVWRWWEISPALNLSHIALLSRHVTTEFPWHLSESLQITKIPTLWKVASLPDIMAKWQSNNDRRGLNYKGITVTTAQRGFNCLDVPIWWVPQWIERLQHIITIRLFSCCCLVTRVEWVGILLTVTPNKGYNGSGNYEYGWIPEMMVRRNCPFHGAVSWFGDPNWWFNALQWNPVIKATTFSSKHFHNGILANDIKS